MNTKKSFILVPCFSCLLLLAIMLGPGCSNPADDVAEAKVEEAQPAAETTASSPEDSQEALTYVASSDSTIGFVGSKVTGSHAGGF